MMTDRRRFWDDEGTRRSTRVTKQPATSHPTLWHLAPSRIPDHALTSRFLYLLRFAVCVIRSTSLRLNSCLP